MKKLFKWFIYLSPVIIAAVYAIVYWVVLPKFVFNTTVGVFKWLFANPDKIGEQLINPSTYLNPILFVIGLKILGWVFFIGFIASLFWVGYTIQNDKPAVSSGARLVGNAPYLTALDFHGQIKAIDSPDVKAAEQALYTVCERLRHESEFGSGDASVISCENAIASYLDEIEENIFGLHDEATIQGAAKKIEILCQRILGKLKMRIELKKK